MSSKKLYNIRSSRFTPIVDQVVAICYDGKWGRVQRGVITQVSRRWFIVEFLPWAQEEDGLVTLKIARRKGKRNKCYGGWLRGRGESGIMSCLFGCPGDWYSVLPFEILRDSKCWPYD